MLAISKYAKIPITISNIALDLAGIRKERNTFQSHETVQETAAPPPPSSDSTEEESTPPPNNISDEVSSTSPDAISEEGTACFISNEEFQRVWFTLIGIIAAAAIALNQGRTEQKKFLRSLNLTAQVSFAISLCIAVIGFSLIFIFRTIGNARTRGSFSRHTLKISMLAATTGFMLTGIFMILAINIARGLN